MNHDYLPGTDFLIEQKEGMFHINSDTELLGRFLQVRTTDTILDIGTNNGALLLYGAQYHPRSLTGIDLFEEVLSSAQNNLENNGFQAELVCTRLQDFRHEPFSLIVVNPPYFDTSAEQLKNENPYLKAARHSDNLPLEDLFDNAERLLKDHGKLFLVHRAVNLQKILYLSSIHHLRCARLRFAFDHPHGRAKSVLLELRKGRCPEIQICENAYLNDRNTF